MNETTTTPAHADYPHDPGTLYDCPACETPCEVCGRPIVEGDEPGTVQASGRWVTVCSEACTVAALDADRWTTGPVTLDGEVTVLAVYDEDDRWNGFLAAPALDAYGVVTVLTVLDEAYADDGVPVDYGYDWTTDGDAFRITDRQARAEYGEDAPGVVEILHPDEDGLYRLGERGWVWTPADEDAPLSAPLDALTDGDGVVWTVAHYGVMLTGPDDRRTSVRMAIGVGVEDYAWEIADDAPDTRDTLRAAVMAFHAAYGDAPTA